MRRPVGLAVAAVVLSVTLGVLIGLVIHAGMVERADRQPPITPGTAPPGTAESAESAESLVTGDETAASPPPWQPSLTPVSDPVIDGASAVGPGGSSSADTGSASPQAAAGSSSPQDTSVSSTAADTTPSTAANPVASPGTGAAATTATRTPGGTATGAPGRPSTGSTVTAHTGSDVPDGPCSTLGARSATSGGATLYCQHDQADGSLRWRPITNGGGCLNRTMTGIGLDGHRYACREGAGGLNHWQRID